MVGNTQALEKACKNLKLSITFLDENKNLAVVNKSGKDYFFANAAAPLNSDSLSKITEDKEFTYRILKDVVAMPETKGYVDPFMKGRFTKYIKYTSYEKVVVDMLKQFKPPFIIKPNSKQQGINVKEIKSEEEAVEHLAQVFNQRSKNYDNIALAQEKVGVKDEFRAFTVSSEVVLIERRTSKNRALGSDLRREMEDFIEPAFKALNLMWGGADIALDSQNKLWLLELNTRPGFTNPTPEKVQLYERMLEVLGD